MAQILLSSLGITDIRGKLGGTQYTKVVSGNQAISPTTPRQTFSTYRQESQRNFRAVMGEWQDLSTSERETWQTAVETGDWDRVNSVGESYVPSPQSLFIQLNLAAYAESFPIREGPTYPSFTTISIDSIGVQTNGTVRMYFSTSSISSGETMIIFGSGNLPAGRWSSNQSRIVELIRVAGASFSSPVTLSSEWATRWNVPIEGMSVFLRAELMNTATGARQDLGYMRTIVEV